MFIWRKRDLSVRWKSRARSSTWLQSSLPTLTSLGCHLSPWAPTSTSAPRNDEGNPFRKWNFTDSTCQSFPWFISLSYPPVLHHAHCFKLSSFYILPSFYITKQSRLHFTYLNPIFLFYFQSQIPYFSFYKFPLNCTVRFFPLLLGYPEALFSLCHHSSSVLWFAVIFLLFPILILDNSCCPVENIHAAPLWSSELFSQSSSFAPQHINLFSLKNKISEAFGWLWIFCCSASPKAATSGSWNKVCTVKV